MRPDSFEIKYSEFGMKYHKFIQTTDK